ncbi:MAG: ribulose-phosphate 3-epimerase [Bacilli bacterium]|nr:ribulose-phosphate 3-epimerase [Bacilli bacterium]
MRKIYISPSILAADFYKLGEEIKAIEDTGAEYLHFDVMDGHFVNNISFGVPVLKSIGKRHHLINDVHLMIEEPFRYAPKFIEAGANIITFHLEAVNETEVFELVKYLHDNKIKAGISIKPNTPVETLLPYLEIFDLVLIMSVEPGFGGQEFMENALDKIAFLRKEIDDKGYHALIEVDGGINEETAKRCIDAGIDILVAGSYIFKSKDYKKAVDSLRK